MTDQPDPTPSGPLPVGGYAPHWEALRAVEEASDTGRALTLSVPLSSRLAASEVLVSTPRLTPCRALDQAIAADLQADWVNARGLRVGDVRVRNYSWDEDGGEHADYWLEFTLRGRAEDVDALLAQNAADLRKLVETVGRSLVGRDAEVLASGAALLDKLGVPELEPLPDAWA